MTGRGVARVLRVGAGASLLFALVWLGVGVVPPESLADPAGALYPDRASFFDEALLEGILRRARWAAALWLGVAAGLAPLAWWVGRRAPSRSADEGGRLGAPTPGGRDVAVGLAVLALAAVAVRLPYLDLPLRYDEAFTYLRYVSKPLPVGLSVYSAPNNHLLHTGAAWLTTTVFGDAEWALRLPAFAAGVGLVPAVFLLGRRAVSEATGWMAAALVVAWPVLAEYSVNARGYTPAALLLVILWWMTLRFEERDGRIVAGWAVAASLTLWAIPSTAVLVAGAALALVPAAVRAGRAARGRVAAAWTGAAMLTSFLYTPPLVVSGVAQLAGNEFVQPSTASLAGRLGAIVAGAAEAFSWGMPSWVAVAAGVGAVAGSARRGAGTPLLHSGATAAAGLLLLGLTPPARTWIPLLPLAAVALGAFLALPVERAAASMAPSRPLRVRLAPAAAAALAAVVAASVLAAGVVGTDPTTGLFPEGPAVARRLAAEASHGDAVAAHTPVSRPLEYYLGREGRSDLPGTVPAPGGRLLLVTREPDQDVGMVLDELGLPGDVELHPLWTLGAARVYRMERPR